MHFKGVYQTILFEINGTFMVINSEIVHKNYIF